MRISRGDSPQMPAVASVQNATAPEPSSDNSSGLSFGRLIEGVGRELDAGETVTRSAIASISVRGAADPGQLIALQAGVYRYSELIDLASRLVDRVTGSVKTVLQGGGQ
jgi:hypothetical protein